MTLLAQSNDRIDAAGLAGGQPHGKKATALRTTGTTTKISGSVAVTPKESWIQSAMRYADPTPTTTPTSVSVIL